jgi:pantothenate synthetase
LHGIPAELSTYPRDLLRDEKLCREAGVAIVFVPDAVEIYPTRPSERCAVLHWEERHGCSPVLIVAPIGPPSLRRSS